MEVHTIDLLYQDIRLAIAAYLIEHEGNLALVDPGPSICREELHKGIREAGFEPKQVRQVFLTHVHLDHAGDAGWWGKQGSQIFVHERGAKHVINPSKLLDSARMIYGGAMESLFGEVAPCPEAQVKVLGDEQSVMVGSLKVTAWDTPGHCRHHLAYVIGDAAFTGDVAGARLPGSKFISVTGAPPQFDLQAYKTSLIRLGMADFRKIYPTHFGEVTKVMEHLMAYQTILEESTAWVQAKLDEGIMGPDLATDYQDYCRERATCEGVNEAMWDTYELANPSMMSADGIALYLKKKEALK